MLRDDRFKVVTGKLLEISLDENRSWIEGWISFYCHRFIGSYPGLGWTRGREIPDNALRNTVEINSEMYTEIACMLGYFGHILPPSAIKEVALVKAVLWNDKCYSYGVHNWKMKRESVMEVFV